MAFQVIDVGNVPNDGSGDKLRDAFIKVNANFAAIPGSANVGTNQQIGTAYTVQLTDNGWIIELNNAATTTVSLPNNLPTGFRALLVQTGLGAVAAAALPGATQAGATTTTAQWTTLSIYVRTNTSGGNAAWAVVAGTAAGGGVTLPTLDLV